MPEKTSTCTTDSSLLTSLPPPTAEIIIDKIPHTPEESQLKPVTPFGKKRSPSMGGARIFAGTALSRPKIQRKQYPLFVAAVIDEEDTLKYSSSSSGCLGINLNVFLLELMCWCCGSHRDG